MALDLANFHLKKAVLEWRYEESYALWDRAGEIWSKAKTKWPTMKGVKAEPGATVFRVDNRFELAVNLDKFFVIAHSPRSDLSDFLDYCDHICNIVAPALEINEYSRLGFRLIYEMKYGSKDESAKAVLEAVPLSVPTGKHFNIAGKFVNPELSFRWEGDNFGIKVSIASQSPKLEYDAPIGVEELKSLKIEKELMTLDIDYYTLNLVSVGQFRARDWISQAYHLMRRDVWKFLKGT